MEIYAIRKNKYAGVYTKKEIFDYIKRIDPKLSNRFFKESEKAEALKWAGVDNVNKYHSSLNADKEFNKLLAKLNLIDVIDIKETNTTVKGQTKLANKSLAEEVHKSNVENKVCANTNNNVNMIEVIEKYKKDFDMFLIKTLSFGDIYYLCNFWYYEKPWDIEYGYSIKDLLKYDYIDYKLSSKIILEHGYMKIQNIYKLDSCNEYEQLTVYHNLMFMDVSEIRCIIPIKKEFLSWYCEGEYQQFMSRDLKSKEIENELS